ncbi:uncharacterized protein LOC108670693 [Hyalella azteca]|uniref:Uncharacterized protein LOC108670693 n=1 Tax=Hyalella azteca TaxID=294128 RepID=A0A8B7NJ45_HYAAZ|nr:uncharacterized protein LOC108670693 [Hyalella azteca]
MGPAVMAGMLRRSWSLATVIPIILALKITITSSQFHDEPQRNPTRQTIYGQQPFYRYPFENRNPFNEDSSRRYGDARGSVTTNDDNSPYRESNVLSQPPVEGSFYEQQGYGPDLKTSPLTSTRKKEIGPKSNSIESSLAAIFRGVAYGVSSAPTTTPKPTTTTFISIVSSSLPSEQNSNKNLEDGSGAELQHHVEENNFQDIEDVENSKDELVPSSIPSTTPSTDVERAGIDDWQSGLQGAWEVHIYCSAASFSLLAIISFLCIVRVHMSTYLLSRGYYITAHLLVFLASFFRCVSFFHDPYASGSKLPNALSDVLFNIGAPCMTAAFSVVALALLNCARIILLPLNLQNPLVFGLISGVYICSNILVDILAGIHHRYKWTEALRASVQALTAGWTGALCLGYAIIFYRIERSAARQRQEIMRLSYNRENMDNFSTLRRLPTQALSRGARLLLVASFCGLAVSVLQVYGLMTPVGLIQLPPKEPWMWFGYQTSCRLLEIIMWSCICVAAALSSSSPLDKQTNDDHSLVTFSCKRCTSCSDISSCQESPDKKLSENLYPTMCHSNLSARNFSVDVNGKLLTEDCGAISRMTYSPGQRDTEKLSRKSNTLHSATSDLHLLWGGQHSNSSTSRPASMVFNENGIVRFRTQNENGEFHEVQRGPFPIEEMPPGYADQMYNVSHPDKSSYTLGRLNHGQLAQHFNGRSNIDAFGRTMPGKSQTSDNGAEYNYCEIPSGVMNEYSGYASACSSMSAANSFDVRMYDDYEVASYYHSPINGPASTHVYDSLRPKVHSNITPKKIIRSVKVPPSPCFSSPRSMISGVGSQGSPKNAALHNSDSDLCSSATDRTQICSSKGNEGRRDANECLQFQRPSMKRHSSHPGQMQEEDRNEGVAPLMPMQNYRNQIRQSKTTISGAANSPPNHYSPSDSDDLYTPLMGDGNAIQTQPNNCIVVGTNSHDKVINLSQSYDLHGNRMCSPFTPNPQIKSGKSEATSPSRVALAYDVNLDQSYKPSVNDINDSAAKFSQNCSDSRSPESKSNHYSIGLVNSPLLQSPSHPNPSDSINSKQVSPRRSKLPGDSINENSSILDEQIYRNDADILPIARPIPPPVPHRPSLAETWVNQSRDGCSTKTEFVRKSSRKGNKSLASPTKSTGSPSSPVSNL